MNKVRYKDIINLPVDRETVAST